MLLIFLTLHKSADSAEPHSAGAIILPESLKTVIEPLIFNFFETVIVCMGRWLTQMLVMTASSQRERRN